MPSVLAFSFALASRSARSLSVLASVASNTALYSAIAAEGASGVARRWPLSAKGRPLAQPPRPRKSRRSTRVPGADCSLRYTRSIRATCLCLMPIRQPIVGLPSSPLLSAIVRRENAEKPSSFNAGCR